MQQFNHTRTLYFDLEISQHSITKSEEQIKALETALYRINSRYYPIFQTSRNTFQLRSNSIFSAEDLFYRIMLMVGAVEKMDLPKELPD